MKRILFGVMCCGLLGLPAGAQQGAKNGEWRTYGGDLGNTHYCVTCHNQRLKTANLTFDANL